MKLIKLRKLPVMIDTFQLLYDYEREIISLPHVSAGFL